MLPDISNISKDIISQRPETFDLFGKPTRTWPVIYMAPQWSFSYRGKKGENRNPVKEGTPINLGQLTHLPVPQLLDKDGVVLVWTTDARFPQLLSLFESWGLRYNGVTFYWAKTRDDADLENMHHERDLPMSTGYITRSNPSMLVMGVRGEPGLRKHNINGEMRRRADIRKLQFAPRMPNNRPHPKFRGLIEQLYDGPYLELFSDPLEGWDSWQMPKAPDSTS